MLDQPVRPTTSLNPVSKPDKASLKAERKLAKQTRGRVDPRQYRDAAELSRALDRAGITDRQVRVEALRKFHALIPRA